MLAYIIKFISVDIGGFDKNSDAGIFEVSNMGKRFEANMINAPKRKSLSGQNNSCHYVIIGDRTFSLKPYLLRLFPYIQSKADGLKQNYNARHCRPKKVVEHAFGILAQKW